MIFISLGSREYQFNRLLNQIDILVEQNVITDDIFAQIGQSDYTPKNYNYKRFLSSEEYSWYQEQAEIIISHGGTGSLVSALKKGKKVIAVPRLAKYGEHIDDHQLQVSNVLANENYLITVTDMEELGQAIHHMQEKFDEIREYNRPSEVLNIIDAFIQGLN